MNSPSSDGPPNGERVVAALYVPEPLDEWWTVTARLLAGMGDVGVVVGGSWTQSAQALEDLGVDFVNAHSGASFMNTVWARHNTHLLAVSGGVVPMPGFLDLALCAISGDPRIGTVSFLSNDAGFLSFPHRNRSQLATMEGYDETSLTRRLRSLAPPPALANVPFAVGAMVLVSRTALGTVGALEDAPSRDLSPAIADLSLKARLKGFSALVDCGTYMLRPSDLNTRRWDIEPWVERPLSDLSQNDEHWLYHRHPLARPFLALESTATDSSFALGHNTARVKIQGLRILIDGSCLSSSEQGSQVAALSMIESLARHDAVREVCVALQGEIALYRDLPSRDQKYEQRLWRLVTGLSSGGLTLAIRLFSLTLTTRSINGELSLIASSSQSKISLPMKSETISAHQRGGSHTGSLYVGQHEWWMESLSSRKMSPKWWPENSCRSSRRDFSRFRWVPITLQVPKMRFCQAN